MTLLWIALYLALAAETVAAWAPVWLPLVVSLVLASTLLRLAGVRTPVRTGDRTVSRRVWTVSRRCRKGGPSTPLTRPDTCPDSVADPCPEIPGQRSTDGGH